MSVIKSIHKQPTKSKDEPLKLSESVGTFIFSQEDMAVVLSEIGKNIRKYRMKYGMSIDELASLAGITKGTLYKIEKNSSGIGLVVLLKISYVLQRPVGDFIPFSYSNTEKRKSLGETIDEICCGLSKEAQRFILNFIKTFVKYACLHDSVAKNSKTNP